MRSIRSVTAATAVGIGVMCLVLALGGAGRAQPDRPPPAGPDIGRMLLDGLKSVEGCLGAETAQFSNGKVAIFGWFKDAEAARRWYYHPVHARLMQMAGDDAERPKPLAHVPDDTPVLVIATIRPTDQPKIPGVPLPIDMISIEMFTPAPGGAYINGRLSPETFEVKHMRKLVIEAPGP